MRKMLLGLALVACLASVANAQLNLFYDARATTAEIVTPVAPYTNSASLSYYAYAGIGQNYPLANGGGKGDGQMIWVSPQIHDIVDAYGQPTPDGYDENFYSWSYGALDYSRGSFYLYADYSADAGNVVSSIGLAQNIPAAGFSANGSFFLESAATTATAENLDLWSGYYINGSNDSTSLKFVQVPVTTGTPPAFDAAAGIVPGSLAQIAKVDVRGAYRVRLEEKVKTYGVKLAVNELLCTQVKYPGTAGDLTVKLGYANGVPEAAGSGSTQGVTSATDDMTMYVVRKGDFDLDGAAATGIDSLAWFDIVKNSNFADPNWNPFEQWLGDFDGDGVPCTGIDWGEYSKQFNVLPLP
jgi:hypothetical protein